MKKHELAENIAERLLNGEEIEAHEIIGIKDEICMELGERIGMIKLLISQVRNIRIVTA